ncbi:tRNA-Thr(GGU) m(6)t(6)A37 methyltransferase TsaA [Alkalispirillum mobile]|uniref:tRNA-Thr(GGU) m(6)t(6)A37 methyltransferase TsaA n=1 Tax=Alkalispirillum mobile TaxID=85925 RepID=A0A498CCE4_9GAMM|nr:tRNA-Thr(GGU) m(6)t(6)A37 methyltransferase TsaA [Alkalispirillum mobile]
MPPIQPIGRVRTPFPERFGIPRQGGLVEAIPGTLDLDAPHDRPEAWQGIEAFSHLWLVTWFHAGKGQGGLTVRPPRLGGNRRLGVFATRAPYRPNPMGLSLVRLAEADLSGPRARIVIRGPDLLDRTPLLDVKPYVPYCDAVPDARGGFAATAPDPLLRVVWTDAARRRAEAEAGRHAGLVALIEAVLAADPRPAYQKSAGRQYGVRLYDLDVHWRVVEGVVEVLGVQRVGA